MWGGDLLFFHGLSPLPVVVASTNEDHVFASSAPVDLHRDLFPLVTTFAVIVYRVIELLMKCDGDGAMNDLLLEERLLFFWRLRGWNGIFRRFGAVGVVFSVGWLPVVGLRV